MVVLPFSIISGNDVSQHLSEEVQWLGRMMLSYQVLVSTPL